MIPDFMDYFAETYPNISADTAKLAPGTLMDFGDRRLAVMDENRIDFVVLSLAGPGVQVEKDAAIAERKAGSVNDFLAAENSKTPGGDAHPVHENTVFRHPPLDPVAFAPVHSCWLPQRC